MREKNSSSVWRWIAVCLLAMAAVPLFWPSGTSSDKAEPAVAEDAADTAWIHAGEIDIQFREGTDASVLTALSQKVGAQIDWNGDFSATETEDAHLTVPTGGDADAILATLRADSHVEAADFAHVYQEPQDEITKTPDTLLATTQDNSNRWKPNDPRYNEQWNFRMVKAEEAWEVTKGKGVIVAVIDTGVAYKDTAKGKRARDFGDTQFVEGYDFVNRDAFPNDDQGHGTHVSGTIAESTNNKEGVAGLAFEAKIMPLKVLSSTGSGTTRDIAEAIRWAADHHANVINMSLGGPYPDSVMQSACEYAHKKGVIIVCAAGNSGREGVGYPAAYKDCVAVSSVGPSGNLAFYSSWGKQVAIAAPGGDKQDGGEAGGILQNTVYPDENGKLTDDYFAFQGTSMASPHVAAVAALVASAGVKNPDDIKDILQRSAQKKGPANKYGAGIVDAAAAVRLAKSVYDDGISRFWIVVCLFTGCYFIGKMRQKAGERNPFPFWGTAALSFGLLFPDWLTHFAGLSSHYNLIGHSVLIPGALLIMGAEKSEKRLLGWMALGMTMHLGWEFLRGTAPFGAEVDVWQMLPWIGSNVLVGLGILFSGMTAERE
ncbi:MAG TPA: S8 family peptidase [Chthonomonadaceae bacterium]|nr:S8 family peptidase [Chthonomonadaceae bacterium]